MTSELFGYPISTGFYVIEGCEFALKGNDGQCLLTPKNMLWPPVGHSGIALEIAISGKGLSADRFEGEVVLDGPTSMLTYLATDIERVKSGADGTVAFPSSLIAGPCSPNFEFRVTRDRYSPTKWSLHCRCASARHWKGDWWPTISEYNSEEFAGILSVVMPLDPDCLDVLRSDVLSFLAWVDREVEAWKRGDL